MSKRNNQFPARVIFFVIIVAVAVIGLVLIWQRLPAKVPPPPAGGAPPVSSGTPTSTEPVAEPTPGVVSNPRAVPPGMICGEQNAICVASAVTDMLLTNPITVTGTAIAFENQFSWKIADANGNVIEQGNVMANAPDAGQSGDFQIRSFYASLPHTAIGTLVLFEASAKDGQPIHQLTIPVKLPTTTRISKIALPVAQSATQTDCGKVAVVEVPIVATKLPIEASIQRLLAPIDPEETQGYKSVIPAGTKLISLVVGSGTATAVFSPELDSMGGSCGVSMIRAEIETTLKQFSSVKKVVISVEGKSPDTSLQP